MEQCQKTCQRKSYWKSSCLLWMPVVRPHFLLQWVPIKERLICRQSFIKPHEEWENENDFIAAKPQVTGRLRPSTWVGALGLGSHAPTWASAAPLPTSGGRCGWQAAGSDTRAAQGLGVWAPWSAPAHSGSPGYRSCPHSHRWWRVYWQLLWFSGTFLEPNKVKPIMGKCFYFLSQFNTR